MNPSHPYRVSAQGCQPIINPLILMTNFCRSRIFTPGSGRHDLGTDSTRTRNHAGIGRVHGESTSPWPGTCPGLSRPERSAAGHLSCFFAPEDRFMRVKTRSKPPNSPPHTRTLSPGRPGLGSPPLPYCFKAHRAGALSPAHPEPYSANPPGYFAVIIPGLLLVGRKKHVEMFKTIRQAFPLPRAGVHPCRWWLNQEALRNHLQKGEIEESPFHALRHTAIHNCRLQGHDYFRIMTASGHKTMHVFKRLNPVSKEGNWIAWQGRNFDAILTTTRLTPQTQRACSSAG